MGNPIQYHNTDNPSQIQGWVSHNKGGVHKTAFTVMVHPPGAYPGEGVNENVSPVTSFCKGTLAAFSKVRLSYQFVIFNFVMVCYILVNFCANITAPRFTKILVKEIQASRTSFAGGNNRFSLQTQRLASPLLPVWEVLNPPLLIILLKAHRCMTSVTLADPLGAQGMRTPFSGPNSFIFMQFSEKNLQNRLAHILWELAPPPSGKSWIRHCVNSSRVN